MNKTENARFDALLKTMVGSNAEKPKSSRPASNAERDGDCDETQTRRDTSKDASR